MKKLAGQVRFDAPLTGAENMAIDNELLNSAAIDSPAVLRIYRWSEPTLSLGHFQNEDAIPNDELWATLSRVRRKTGGGAIVHHFEWTYSLVVPNRTEIGLKGHSEAIYRSVHDSVVDGLRELGWDASLSEHCTCVISQNDEKVDPFLCFLRRSPVDVVIGTHKILGSAQRRSSSGLLQHGSFLYRASEFAPEIAGVQDLTRNRDNLDGFLEGNLLEFLKSKEGWIPGPRGPEDVKKITSTENCSLQSEEHGISGLNSVEFGGVDGGNWLAYRIIIGLNRIFQCDWSFQEPMVHDNCGSGNVRLG